MKPGPLHWESGILATSLDVQQGSLKPLFFFFFFQGADHDLHTPLSGIPLLVSTWDTQGKPEWRGCGWFTQDFWAPLLGCVNPLKAE